MRVGRTASPSLNVVFVVDTASPHCYLLKEVMERLELDARDAVIDIHCAKMPVYPSEVNIIGAKFFEKHGATLQVTYSTYELVISK